MVDARDPEERDWLEELRTALGPADETPPDHERASESARARLEALAAIASSSPPGPEPAPEPVFSASLPLIDAPADPRLAERLDRIEATLAAIEARLAAVDQVEVLARIDALARALATLPGSVADRVGDRVASVHDGTRAEIAAAVEVVLSSDDSATQRIALQEIATRVGSVQQSLRALTGLIEEEVSRAEAEAPARGLSPP